MKPINTHDLTAKYGKELWDIVTLHIATQVIVIERNDEQKELSLGEVEIFLKQDYDKNQFASEICDVMNANEPEIGINPFGLIGGINELQNYLGDNWEEDLRVLNCSSDIANLFIEGTEITIQYLNGEWKVANE
ncbi:hypothetical protein MKY96_32575 [Paenibacillus sp. FSL R7-0302]|uniref:hypothetical protein n=1 Tax=Paenibacillus sp. FSL R7-0302 TaxID=2921681 RepID=UPI0030F8DA6A